MTKFSTIVMNLIILASVLVAVSSLVSRRILLSVQKNNNNNNNKIIMSTITTASSKKNIATKSATTKLNQSQNDNDDMTSTNTAVVTTSDEITKNDQLSTDTKTIIQQKTWNPLRLGVLRLGLTEPAMISPLNYGKYDGTFRCAYCDHNLFDSNAKYDSGSGWPSFWRSINNNAIYYKPEGIGRLEVQCNNCHSHLGHVFLDGPKPNTVSQVLLQSSPLSDPRTSSTSKRNNLPRFCINGASLRYTPREEK
jgi:peptide-methionine (R)-S-oxide reductase